MSSKTPQEKRQGWYNYFRREFLMWLRKQPAATQEHYDTATPQEQERMIRRASL